MTDKNDCEEVLAALDKICSLAETANVLDDLVEMFEQQKIHWSQMITILNLGITSPSIRGDQVLLTAMAEIIDTLLVASKAQAELFKNTQISAVGAVEYGRLLAKSMVSMTDVLLTASKQTDALLAVHS